MPPNVTSEIFRARGALLYAKWEHSENPGEKARDKFSERYEQELAAGQLLPSKNFFRQQKNKLLMYGTIEDVVGIIIIQFKMELFIYLLDYLKSH